MLTDLFTDINAAGYRVNNLFQTHDMRWQCNLHRVVEQGDLGDFTCFARGDTAEAAVQAAIKQMVKPAEAGVVEETQPSVDSLFD